MEQGGEAWFEQQPEDLASEVLDGKVESNTKVEPERKNTNRGTHEECMTR